MLESTPRHAARSVTRCASHACTRGRTSRTLRFADRISTATWRSATWSTRGKCSPSIGRYLHALRRRRCNTRSWSSGAPRTTATFMAVLPPATGMSTLEPHHRLQSDGAAALVRRKCCGHVASQHWCALGRASIRFASRSGACRDRFGSVRAYLEHCGFSHAEQLQMRQLLTQE